MSVINVNKNMEGDAMRKKLWGAIAFAGALMTSVSAMAWTLEEAAQPYKGTSIKAIFLDRPGCAAARSTSS